MFLSYHSPDCVAPYMGAFKAQIIRSNTHVEEPVEDADKKEKECAETKFGEKMSAAFRAAALGDVPDSRGEAEADDASLCDISFSLAFGGKILLHNTHLRLGKGRRYGLMGKNGAGKTTLLTNIGSGNIEGMPPHLRMVYVQHDDASDDFGVPLIDEIMKVITVFFINCCDV
jgi:ABC transporter